MNIKLTSFSIFLILLFVLVISSICWNCFIVEGFPSVATTEEVQATDAVTAAAESETTKAALISAGVPATTVIVSTEATTGSSTINLDNPNLKPGDVIVVDGNSYKISSNAITAT
jgi:zona occludens toxin (predicted ATPase)